MSPQLQQNHVKGDRKTVVSSHPILVGPLLKYISATSRIVGFRMMNLLWYLRVETHPIRNKTKKEAVGWLMIFLLETGMLGMSPRQKALCVQRWHECGVICWFGNTNVFCRQTNHIYLFFSVLMARDVIKGMRAQNVTPSAIQRIAPHSQQNTPHSLFLLLLYVLLLCKLSFFLESCAVFHQLFHDILVKETRISVKPVWIRQQMFGLSKKTLDWEVP